MSRRLTSDRFYGGVEHRIRNLQSFLAYLRRWAPTRNETAAWLENELGAKSETTRDRYLSFLRGLELVERVGSHLHPGTAGLRYLHSPDSETLFTILDAGVAGFDLMLEALATRGALTDEQLRLVLNSGPYGHSMDGKGVAIRHREWLQALGYACREKDDGNRRTVLTDAGYELCDRTRVARPAVYADGVFDGPADRRLCRFDPVLRCGGRSQYSLAVCS